MGAALDATSRTLQARIDTKNPEGRLKKDMYVTATVVAGKSITHCWCRMRQCYAMPRMSRSFM